MAALIEYVCTAQHDRREEASVTLEQGSWASKRCARPQATPARVSSRTRTLNRPAPAEVVSARAFANAKPRYVLRTVKQVRMRGWTIA